MILACDACPTAKEKESKKYDCIKIHKNTRCPELLGSALKEIREKNEEFTEDIKELREEESDLKKDIADKEQELMEDLAEIKNDFIESRNKMERETETVILELEAALEEGNVVIEENLLKQVDQIQVNINESLAIQHKFTNAFTEINKKYRKTKLEITMACEAQANSSLAQYRQRRKASIHTGSLKISISDLLSGNRSSFHEIDEVLYTNYKAKCLKQRSRDFKEVEADYKNDLKALEQKKQEYLEALKRLKAKLTTLNESSLKAKNKQLEKYTEQMERVLQTQQKNFENLSQQHKIQKTGVQSKTQALNVLKANLTQKQNKIKNKTRAHLESKEMILYLREQGVEEDEDQKTNYTNLLGARNDYDNAIQSAIMHCSCESDESDPPSKYCKKIQEAEESINIKTNEGAGTGTPINGGRWR